MEIKLLRVVVASPGDVRDERGSLEEVAAELNRGIAADRGLRLEVARWETDAYPGFHPEGPQGLIDPILSIEDCDVLVGIFWKRFGTPTGQAQSGTEHEIRTAYEAWQEKGHPHIMVYFNQQPYSPQSPEEAEQWAKVLQFREDFPSEGLWWAYSGADEFEDLVRNHLIQFLRNKYPLVSQLPVADPDLVLSTKPPKSDEIQPKSKVEVDLKLNKKLSFILAIIVLVIFGLCVSGLLGISNTEQDLTDFLIGIVSFIFGVIAVSLIAWIIIGSCMISCTMAEIVLKKNEKRAERILNHSWCKNLHRVIPGLSEAS